MVPEIAWSTPELLGEQPGGSELALAVIKNTPHLVWNRGGVLYHSQRIGTNWSVPDAIAMGEAPALAVSPDGQLHCLFANLFAGSSEIYHTIWSGLIWSLPINVSHTGGESTQPTVAVGPDGGLHAAWADTTPGFPAVYYATYANGFWSSGPIPNGRGQKPALGVGVDNTVYAAWEDQATGSTAFDVFCARRTGQSWSMPDLISDSQSNSVEPSLAVSADGNCFIAWQEQVGIASQIYFAQHAAGGWTAPAAISAGDHDCLLPRLVAGPHDVIELVWLQSVSLNHRAAISGPQARWLPIEVFATTGLLPTADLSIGSGEDGMVYVVWSTLIGSDWATYYAVRAPELNHQLYLPAISQSK